MPLSGSESPATHAALVTPNDSANLVSVSRALLIGNAGNLKVDTLGGETLVMPVPAGLLPIRVTKIYASNTTANNIVTLW